MPKQKSQAAIAAPWQVPLAVEDVAEIGQHVDLVADDAVRMAVARVAGLRDLPRLQASFEVTGHGTGGLHVTGTVSATVGQDCVVTLEPLSNEVEERVDLVFLPPEASASATDDSEGSDGPPGDIRPDGPERLIGVVVDLGAIATEFLILGLDPYPRKPGAVFDPPAQEKPEESPFAGLAKLKG